MNEFEEKELASYSSRAWAYCIDFILISVIFFILFYNLHEFSAFKEAISEQIKASANLDNQNLDALALSQAFNEQFSSLLWLGTKLFFILQFGYMFIFLSTSGATIGCMICKIKHVNKCDFGPASYFKAALKALAFTLMSGFLFGALFLTMCFHPLRQSLADLIGDQVVIRA